MDSGVPEGGVPDHAAFDAILKIEKRVEGDNELGHLRKRSSAGGGDSFRSSSGRSSGLRSMDSMIDTSNKRIRHIQPQGPVVEITDGYEDSLIAHLVGEKTARQFFQTMDHGFLFYLNGILCLIGLAFTVADITNESVPLWMSFMCVLVLPWGIFVLSLLNYKVLGLLLGTFNTWFLLAQVIAMCVCIGLVAERPFMICVLAPTLIASILVDAYPQRHRWHVTALTYLALVSFSLAFDVSLLFSLFPVTDPLSFTVNDMEFSGKALAFGCSLNLLAFCLRNVTIMVMYPDCLVLYTSNLKSERVDTARRDPNMEWKNTISSTSSIGSLESFAVESHEENFWWRSKEEAEDDKELVWIIRPMYDPITIKSKNTLAQSFLGRRVNLILWATAKNPLSAVVMFCGIPFMLPTLKEGIIPSELTPISFLIFATLGSGIMLLNTRLVGRLLKTFQVWFLMSMSVILMITWYSRVEGFAFASFPVVFFGVSFSFLMDAYPGSGRFLAGVRFYSLKISIATLLVIFILTTNVPEEFFNTSIGEVTLSGSAMCFSAALNLITFGCRNMYQLIVERDCLVVLSCLMEYVQVTKREALYEISKYA